MDGRLTEAEKMEKGSIPWSTFHIYIMSAGGYIVSFFVLLTFVLNIFSTGTFNPFFSYVGRFMIRMAFFLFHLRSFKLMVACTLVQRRLSGKVVL